MTNKRQQGNSNIHSKLHDAIDYKSEMNPYRLLPIRSCEVHQEPVDKQQKMIFFRICPFCRGLVVVIIFYMIAHFNVFHFSLIRHNECNEVFRKNSKRMIELNKTPGCKCSLFGRLCFVRNQPKGEKLLKEQRKIKNRWKKFKGATRKPQHIGKQSRISWTCLVCWWSAESNHSYGLMFGTHTQSIIIKVPSAIHYLSPHIPTLDLFVVHLTDNYRRELIQYFYGILIGLH